MTEERLPNWNLQDGQVFAPWFLMLPEVPDLRCGETSELEDSLGLGGLIRSSYRSNLVIVTILQASDI